jgi:hypothetical protein
VGTGTSQTSSALLLRLFQFIFGRRTSFSKDMGHGFNRLGWLRPSPQRPDHQAADVSISDFTVTVA